MPATIDTSDLKSIICQATADDAYIHEVAHLKRALELWLMDAPWQKDFAADPVAALKKHNLDVSPDDVRILTDPALGAAHQGFSSDVPRPVRRYRAFVMEKLNMRFTMREKNCVPKNKIN